MKKKKEKKVASNIYCTCCTMVHDHEIQAVPNIICFGRLIKFWWFLVIFVLKHDFFLLNLDVLLIIIMYTKTTKVKISIEIHLRHT